MSIKIGDRAVVVSQAYYSLPVGCPATVRTVFRQATETCPGLVEVVKDGDNQGWTVYTNEVDVIDTGAEV